MNAAHTYIQVLLGIILTAVIGAWLAEQYRARSAEFETAQHVFQDQSELLGQRLHAMSELLHALKDGKQPDAVETQMAAYRAFLGDYNAKRNYNRVMIELYFGEPIYNEERDLHYQMRYIGQEIECDYRERWAVNPAALDDAIAASWEKLSDLSKHMGAALRDDKIGRNRPTAAAPPTKDEPNFVCNAGPQPR